MMNRLQPADELIIPPVIFGGPRSAHSTPPGSRLNPYFLVIERAGLAGFYLKESKAGRQYYLAPVALYDFQGVIDLTNERQLTEQHFSIDKEYLKGTSFQRIPGYSCFHYSAYYTDGLQIKVYFDENAKVLGSLVQLNNVPVDLALSADEMAVLENKAKAMIRPLEGMRSVRVSASMNALNNTIYQIYEVIQTNSSGADNYARALEEANALLASGASLSSDMQGLCFECIDYLKGIREAIKSFKDTKAPAATASTVGFYALLSGPNDDNIHVVAERAPGEDEECFGLMPLNSPRTPSTNDTIGASESGSPRASSSQKNLAQKREIAAAEDAKYLDEAFKNRVDVPLIPEDYNEQIKRITASYRGLIRIKGLLEQAITSFVEFQNNTRYTTEEKSIIVSKETYERIVDFCKQVKMLQTYKIRVHEGLLEQYHSSFKTLYLDNIQLIKMWVMVGGNGFDAPFADLLLKNGHLQFNDDLKEIILSLISKNNLFGTTRVKDIMRWLAKNSLETMRWAHPYYVEYQRLEKINEGFNTRIFAAYAEMAKRNADGNSETMVGLLQDFILNTVRESPAESRKRVESMLMDNVGERCIQLVKVARQNDAQAQRSESSSELPRSSRFKK